MMFTPELRAIERTRRLLSEGKGKKKEGEQQARSSGSVALCNNSADCGEQGRVSDMALRISQVVPQSYKL